MATVALTKEQYQDIIETMQTGGNGFRSNPRIAAALQLEANLGMRIGDILQLRLVDIIRDAGRYRLNVTEEKTGKKRSFTVPAEVYSFLRDYADANGIGKEDRLFPLTVRAVQKQLKLVCDYLELENVSTHSFRKFMATNIYENSGHNIALVQTILQHSSPTITRRYIGISTDEVEKALTSNINLI
jgi:integrase